MKSEAPNSNESVKYPHTWRILRMPEVLRLTGLKSKSSVYELEKNRAETGFPQRVSLCGGKRASGWHEQEIVEWIRSRPRIS